VSDPVIDHESLTCRVALDVSWMSVEGFLRQVGLTLGWTPPLARETSLRRILEARIGGSRSPLYGDPAACVVGLEVGGGAEPLRKTLAVPRSASGPDYRALYLGARGRFGPLEHVTLRVFPAPKNKADLGFLFPSPIAGVSFLARLMHRGIVPAFALLENADTGKAVVRLRFEGGKALTPARASAAQRLADAVDARRIDPALVTDFLRTLIPDDGRAPSHDRWWGSPPEAGVADDSGESASTSAALRWAPGVLRVDARWDDFPALLSVLRPHHDVDYRVVDIRHHGAALFVDARGMSMTLRELVLSSLRDAGGLVPLEGIDGTPMGARVFG